MGESIGNTYPLHHASPLQSPQSYLAPSTKELVLSHLPTGSYTFLLPFAEERKSSKEAKAGGESRS